MLLALLSLIVAVGVPAQSGANSGTDEAQIRQNVADQVLAWNAGDAKAFSVRFAEDGSFTNVRGTVFYGHRAFEDRHAQIFATFFKGSKLAMTAGRIHLVRPDVAVADIATEIGQIREMPPGVKPRASGKLRTRLQEVLVKDGGEWWVVSYHNVDVKEP